MTSKLGGVYLPKIEVSENELLIIKELRMILSNDEGFLRIDWNRKTGVPKLEKDVKQWLNKE